MLYTRWRMRRFLTLTILSIILTNIIVCPCHARKQNPKYHWTSKDEVINSSLSKNKSNHTNGHHHNPPKPHPTPKPKPPLPPSPISVPTPPYGPSPIPIPVAPPGPLVPPPGPLVPPPPPVQSTTFNVLDYGAKGDGLTDDTMAFQDTWAAACKVQASTMVVPSNYQFLLGPISFAGPTCQPNIVFQLDGTIIGLTDHKKFGSGLLQWIEFTKLKGITIQGLGVIDGRGDSWWNINSYSDNEPDITGSLSQTRPTAVRFYGSYNVTVTGITIRNSPQFHLKFDACQSVEVHGITVSSPGNSPNTDGIHLQNSISVTIHHSNLSCGDDCISIQTGCSNVFIHDINCGPGHGISIGGLGKDNTIALVSNINVQNINMTGTTSAARIKTWQGGSGSVTNVKFTNIQVSAVKTPVVIDQYYCDSASGVHCKNETSAVQLSDITFQDISGTYTAQPVYLACSDNSPCHNIHLNNIQLQPIKGVNRLYDPFCWKAFGDLRGANLPPINCLKS